MDGSGAGSRPGYLEQAPRGGSPAASFPNTNSRSETTEMPSGEAIEADPLSARYLYVRTPRLDVALDFYLVLGCEVHIAADGWAVLRTHRGQFVLIHSPAAVEHLPVGKVVHLWLTDLAELGQLVLGMGTRVTSTHPVTAGLAVFAGDTGRPALIREYDSAADTVTESAQSLFDT